MDARHESLAHETVNQLIEFINHYIAQHTDEVVSHMDLLEDMKMITSDIYQLAGRAIEVEAMLSRQNLLSTDVVCLPLIDEMVVEDNEFDEFLVNMEMILATRGEEQPFYRGLSDILLKMTK